MCVVFMCFNLFLFVSIQLNDVAIALLVTFVILAFFCSHGCFLSFEDVQVIALHGLDIYWVSFGDASSISEAYVTHVFVTW